MVQIIYGAKGSGKTKRLIAMANAEIEQTKGNVVFIDDDKRYMYDVKHQVRFVDVTEYAIDSEDKLYGFISGMLAQNFDISAIYIDAFLHMIKKTAHEAEALIAQLKRLAEAQKVKLVINVSAPEPQPPAFMAEHVI